MRSTLLSRLAVAALAVWLAAGSAAAQQSIYRVRMPPVIDPLHRFSVVVILHDAGGNGTAMLDDERVVAGFIDRGYAVLAPDALPRENRRYTIIGDKPTALESAMDGVRGSYSDKRFVMRDPDGSLRNLRWGRDSGWYFYSTDRSDYTLDAAAGEFTGIRDEILFLRRLLEDAAARYPVDPQPALIVGLGHGGSLVWQIACSAPRLARLLAPVDGAYWHELPADCAAGADLIHAHHRSSDFWPLGGASGGKRRYARTAIGDNLAVLLQANRCMPETDSPAAAGAQGTRWRRCGAGGPVELMLLDEPFAFQPAWFERIHARLDGFGLRQPFDTPELPEESSPQFSQPGADGDARFKSSDAGEGSALRAPDAEDGARLRAPEAGTGSRFVKPGAGAASPFKRPGAKPDDQFKPAN